MLIVIDLFVESNQILILVKIFIVKFVIVNVGENVLELSINFNINNKLIDTESAA